MRYILSRTLALSHACAIFSNVMINIYPLFVIFLPFPFPPLLLLHYPRHLLSCSCCHYNYYNFYFFSFFSVFFF